MIDMLRALYAEIAHLRMPDAREDYWTGYDAAVVTIGRLLTAAGFGPGTSTAADALETAQAEITRLRALVGED